MTYDTVVIGAGLAGLTAALRLAEEGRRVAVLARGVGATHLAPATIDVLGYDGERRVDSPARALSSFLAAHPEHPYARVGPELVAESVAWLAERAGDLAYVGGLDHNLLLPTAVGAARPSAVVPASMADGDLRFGGTFVFVGLRGLKDFFPAYLAGNVARAANGGQFPLSARALELSPPLGGEADVNALGFASRFEDAGFLGAVAAELAPQLERGERVAFPAVLGLARASAVRRELEERLERPVFEVATLPPSVTGIRLFERLKSRLRATGARLVVGDRVVGAEVRGRRVEAVHAEAAVRRVAFRARSFVLASGGLASGGLELDSRGRVRETVFDLPVASAPDAREARFLPGYFDDHPLSRAGLAVDERLRPLDADGEAVYENLHVAGATLGGAVPWREKSGNGISVATGYAAAAAVLEGERVLQRVS